MANDSSHLVDDALERNVTRLRRRHRLARGPTCRTTRDATLGAHGLWRQCHAHSRHVPPRIPVHWSICQPDSASCAVTCGAGGWRPSVGVRLRAAPQALGWRGRRARHRRLRGILCWRRPHLQVDRQSRSCWALCQGFTTGDVIDDVHCACCHTGEPLQSLTTSAGC